jgi:hypothetical protein
MNESCLFPITKKETKLKNIFNLRVGKYLQIFILFFELKPKIERNRLEGY